jgi:cytochrome b involved in lipid metabolism
VSVLEGLFLKYIRMNKKYIGVYFAISSALLFAGAGCPTNVSREIGESEEVKQAVVSEVTSTENIGSVSVGQENKADDSKVQQKKNESENENEGEESDDDGQTPAVSTNTPAPVQKQPAPTTPAPAYTKTTYSMADVKAANTPGKCWTVVSGVVYDLTAWINRHPGGDKNILSLCGLDGTAAYNSVHAGQSKPANVLAGFEIGLLK